MQGQKNALDSFPETVDLNQGSVTNNADMDHSSSWNNMLNPVENRLSSYALSSGEGSFSCLNPVTHNGRSFSGWDLGESSSSAGLQNQNQVSDDGLKMDHDWSSTERQYDDPSVGNSIHMPVNVNLNPGYNAGDIDITRQGLYPNFYKPDVTDVDQMPPVTGSDDVGTSSDNLGSWGLSCKRKSLEGTSSSSCIPQAENNQRSTVAPRQHSASSLNISSPQLNSPTLGRFEQQLNSRIGASFPPLVESSHRNYGVRINPGSQEPVRRSAVRSPYQSRIISVNDTVDFRPTSSVSNSHMMHLPGLPRNMLPHSWNNNGGFSSRPGSSSSSLALRDETSNFRAGLRNNSDHAPLFDPTNWSLATGSSRPGPSSGSRSFPTVWIPHHHHSLPAQNPQRLNEFSPWSLFPPPVESEAVGQRGHFPPYAAGPSSSPEETVMSSGSNGQGHHQTYPRSLMEVPDDVNTSWRALAADIEGRQRLVSEIRQVLNAMRRGESLRAEDYMLFDPLINGVAELHDRHRDMRLDVDNMSYEELLALEERIGDVNTGLSEEKILETMKQQKYLSITFGVRAKMEPCCVCQEEYVNGDDIGTLQCGHDFHTDCIKQWLTQKNVCPICKMAGLGT